jgi:hypothetical protein
VSDPPPRAEATPPLSIDRSSNGFDAPKVPIDLASHSRHRRGGSFFHSVHGFEWYLSLERRLPLAPFNRPNYRTATLFSP